MSGTSEVHVRLGSSIAASNVRSRLTVKVEHGATMSEVAQKLVRLYPALRYHLETAIVTVNGQVVDNNHTAAADDSVAFLAPVAGG
ncbi:MAG: MoaD/ThiS family protein [Arenicellales bacterium]|nr:MoaD/ThiS family protein [Arenicellales bacterium]